MKVTQLKSAAEFLQECENFLLLNETLNNQILGLAASLSNKDRVGNGELFFSVKENDQVIGTALRTDIERPLSISKMPSKALDHLVDTCIRNISDLGGIIDEIESAEYFSKRIQENLKGAPKLIMHQGIYECRNLVIPKNKGHELIMASEDDLELATEFIYGFIRDALPHETADKKKSLNMAKRHISLNHLYFLKDQKSHVVSMACNVRSTKNSGCVSLVFTPGEFRSNGYGALTTALVSQKIIENGKEFCNLFTDLSNPTSNKIYQSIGYKKVGESKHFSFLS